MGSGQSSETLHLNRYLNGKGPASLEHQAEDGAAGVDTVVNGKMTWEVLHTDLPGFPNDDTLQINYELPDGIQTKKHPHPGQPYGGLQLCAYLPENREGRHLLKLLEKAFRQELLFTVITNTKGQDVMTTTSIPLKTQRSKGNTIESYPDQDYLKTLRKILKEKGIK
ncbi:E3 ubiquitin-protein ligase DTX3L [Thalassophryne amazonica]|uniref:E3 ubiquitin-protein ligase DTX3L n=1 Tax=Thalassophryne amazonica TaxID=390379 RepID=UPI001470D4C0|nr:E3 ubiquitin-protein ligase DTX3L [Thalassophryne amazonica]